MNEKELKKEQFIAKAMENKKKFEIHKRKGVEEYDQAVVAITDSKGLNTLYKGNLVYYKNEFIFHYNLKKAIDNQK